jgi:hypothetical protein
MEKPPAIVWNRWVLIPLFYRFPEAYAMADCICARDKMYKKQMKKLYVRPKSLGDSQIWTKPGRYELTILYRNDKMPKGVRGNKNTVFPGCNPRKDR